MNRFLTLLALVLLAAPTARAQDALPALAESIDPSKLVAYSDSFAFIAGGTVMGGQRLTLEPTDDGWRFTERTVIDGRMEQTSVLLLDPALEASSLRHHGTVMGDSMGIQVDFEDGRAVGDARTPDPTGAMVERQIDAELPDGAVDDNALQIVLAALPWSADAAFSGTIFSSGKGEAAPVVLRVAAVEPLQTTGGEVETYRVELEQEGTPAVFWLTTATPHRVIKVGSLAAPFEFVRVDEAAGSTP